mmetsp:Transcript_6737/g.12741  ORF Transcript_6737/g.12741 Transcript_6737/m.12741 type:complete len:269 (-) Transcript_6737:1496-2302(-)
MGETNLLHQFFLCFWNIDDLCVENRHCRLDRLELASVVNWFRCSQTCQRDMCCAHGVIRTKKCRCNTPEHHLDCLSRLACKIVKHKFPCIQPSLHYQTFHWVSRDGNTDLVALGRQRVSSENHSQPGSRRRQIYRTRFVGMRVDVTLQLLKGCSCGLYGSQQTPFQFAQSLLLQFFLLCQCRLLLFPVFGTCRVEFMRSGKIRKDQIVRAPLNIDVQVNRPRRRLVAMPKLDDADAADIVRVKPAAQCPLIPKYALCCEQPKLDIQLL